MEESMNEIQEYSNVMIGSSLCLLGSAVLLQGSLSLIGIAIFVPMALGGLGLVISNLMKIRLFQKVTSSIQEIFYEQAA
jgi:hypothetical protein